MACIQYSYIPKQEICSDHTATGVQSLEMLLAYFATEDTKPVSIVEKHAVGLKLVKSVLVLLEVHIYTLHTCVNTFRLLHYLMLSLVLVLNIQRDDNVLLCACSAKTNVVDFVSK